MVVGKETQSRINVAYVQKLAKTWNETSTTVSPFIQTPPFR